MSDICYNYKIPEDVSDTSDFRYNTDSVEFLKCIIHKLNSCIIRFVSIILSF